MRRTGGGWRREDESGKWVGGVERVSKSGMRRSEKGG